jgi:hypothetical protein
MNSTATGKETTAVAAKFAAEIRANVDALFADEVTHDQHHVRNGATWRGVREAGAAVEDDVLGILRERR